MGTFTADIRFSGVWRPYQQRVLDSLDRYMEDKSIHIVAPPGSGKTTLGLEIIRRLDGPALILSPTLTIREQWIDRFCSSFLPQGCDASHYVSSSLRDIRPLTSITYQALYSAAERLYDTGTDEDAEDEDLHEVDYSDFDLMAAIKKAGITTVCLDEAHHLRSEWWRALEKVLGDMGSIRKVSLTATPPYDVPYTEWERYTALCGEIDEEIYTPELVKEQNICPHQDYIYFSWPTKEELDAIGQFRGCSSALVKELGADQEFIDAFARHPGVLDPERYADTFLENPRYLTAILVLFRSCGIPVSKPLRALIGTSSSLPLMDEEWMEALLQGFLYDDVASFTGCDGLHKRILSRLRQDGLIENKKVMLVSSSKISRMVVTSTGKLQSISTIVQAEYGFMGDQLRLLVLTDYIKKDPGIIGQDTPIRSIGTLPIFESVRRMGLRGLGLAVLSGILVIIPQSCCEALDGLCHACGLNVRYEELPCTGYVEAVFSGAHKKDKVAVMTALFHSGRIQVLIGTKSLLGEGWDAPFINSLILASFVGTYMLSNQMRGRAIRICREDPCKTANIWHLVCIEPVWKYEGNVVKKAALHAGFNIATRQRMLSSDYDTLSRRFKAFLGLHYASDTIEDGMKRLSIVQPPYTPENISHINAQMLALAKDRDTLRLRWEKAMQKAGDVRHIFNMNIADKKLVPRRYVFYNALVTSIVDVLLIYLCLFAIRVVAVTSNNVLLFILLGAFGLLQACILGKNAVRAFRYMNAAATLKQTGEALLRSLQDFGFIKSQGVHIVSSPASPVTVSCALMGGTEHEKNTFHSCMRQLLGPIDNPRYILRKRVMLGMVPLDDYLSVPDVLAARKEYAERFAAHIQRYAGLHTLVYTRTPAGRKALLRARSRSFINKNALHLSGQRKVQSHWE